MSHNVMDQYHRAAKRFHEALGESKEIRHLRDALMRAGTESEKLAGVYFDVTIEEDWIARIERAIPHLEAAIREDRQFIKSEGNITSIERVRKVSRSSVEHLARHSEMITHVPDEGEDLVPDKLQVYENESKYDVYENRVLYMVLCCTRDFLDYRFVKISQAWNEKAMATSCDKTIRATGGKLTFELRLTDKTGGMTEDEDALARKIARIEAATGEIATLLAMPLMKEVAHSPMVTPPITRTNVLRMDQHFKEVVDLYDFLSTYTGDGFTITRHENTRTPFPEEMKGEIAELALFAMYLNYKYGRDCAEELEARYLAEEEEKREAERRAREERLASIRERMSGAEVTVEECLNLLSAETAMYEENLQKLRDELAVASEWKKTAETAAVREDMLRNTIDECRRTSGEMSRRASILAAESRVEQAKLQSQVEELTRSLAEEQEMRRALNARVIAMTEQYVGRKAGADYSERDNFLELEKERDAFERVYGRNWKKAKRKIRKKFLWGKEE